MGECNRTALLQSEIRAGVQPCTRASLFRKQTIWIRPAPRASGLRWCGVPSSYEERQNKEKRSLQGCYGKAFLSKRERMGSI
jgi:hypothetical protein